MVEVIKTDNDPGLVAVELALIKPFYILIRIVFSHDFKGLFTRKVTLAGGQKIPWVYRKNFAG